MPHMSIFLYILASNLSMSYLLHMPTADIGVPMYMSSDLARQQVSCCRTSGSALFSLHLSTLMFFYTYSFATLICSFLSWVTLTPRYFTAFTHLIPPMSSPSSCVSISDFFLLSLRFHSTYSEANSLMMCSSSDLEFVMTSMSSANASRSPLPLTSSSLLDDLIASSRYTLKSTGDSTDPWGRPISALIRWSPICIYDCLCSPLMSSMRVLS